MATDAPRILCIGAAHWDVIGRTPAPLGPGDDLPGRIARSAGGVALNIALALAGHGLRPVLLSAIGRDPEGAALIAEASARGIDCAHVWRDGGLPTDCYMAIEDAVGLVGAVADARGLEAAGAAILAALHDGHLGSATAPWRGAAVLDGNLTEALLGDIARAPLLAGADLRLASASPDKARRLRAFLRHPRACFYLNRAEAGSLCGQVFATAEDAAAALVGEGAHRVVVTDGGNPAADGAGDGVLCAPPPRVAVARVTGAGDAFMAAHIAAELRGANRQAALQAALGAAALHISEGA